MKHYKILLILLLALAACTKNNVDFSFSPANPRAGQMVKFSNLSESGEDWSWSFGDATTSSSKNPSKIYKKPGTYTITLVVDKKSNRRCTRQITVVDTVPSIVYQVDTFNCPDTVPVFEPVTFRASIYNPYSHALTYEWEFGSLIPPVVLTRTVNDTDSLTGSTCRVLFREPQSEEQVSLHIAESYTVQGRDTVRHHYLTCTLAVKNNPAQALLYQLDDEQTSFRQCYYLVDGRWFYDDPVTLLQPGDLDSLRRYQDTIAVYNGHTYTPASLAAPLAAYEPEGIRVLDSRVYFRCATGLYVASLSGENIVSIDSQAVSSLLVDRLHACLYWSSAGAVYCLPLIQSANNRFDRSAIRTISRSGTAVRMAINYQEL